MGELTAQASAEPDPPVDPALAFVRTCATLISQGNLAGKQRDLAAMQELEMQTKVLQLSASQLAGDWAVDFALATQANVSAGLRLMRGMQYKDELRYAHAKQELALAEARLLDYLRLMAATLPRVPAMPGLDELAALFQLSIGVQTAVLPLIHVFDRQCDADRFLLQGRLVDFAAALRAAADQADAACGPLLAKGGNLPDVQLISRALAAQADLLRQRADAVDAQRGAGTAYQVMRGDKVFIIHGHAKGEWQELRTLLETRLGLKGRVVVLKEEANQGQTVIEKFEAWADQCCYAFALLTPDDTVTPKLAKGEAYAQARPNALFETGWFYGRFGPRRLCIVKQAKTQMPSDLGGVATADFSIDVKECFLAIEQELRAAGVVAGP